MTKDRLSQYWPLITILLVIIIIAGSVVAWARYPRSQPIEILTPSGEEFTGDIYVGGAVINPGFYTLKTGDKIEDIIQAAGGTTINADLTILKLYIPQLSKQIQPQRVDINRAESWLLQALPEIGETRAQAIIEYRNQHGPFRHVYELTRVEGIGTITYEKIKHLITISD